MLIVKKNKQFGRYVVTTENIRKGQIVELSELIVISKADAKLIHKTILNAYVYAYKINGIAVALGIGSLFNHSSEPNLAYKLQNEKMKFTAKRNISAGEQLFIDYGYDPV